MNSDPEKVEPPAHYTADKDHFLNLNNEQDKKIPIAFDLENLNTSDIYSMRISHSFDPSKFWVVFKEKELDIFQKYLKIFYSKYEKLYKIPFCHFYLRMNCVVYTENQYYRGLLVNIPLQIKGESWAFVYLFDFGYMAKVNINEIYFMTREMYTIPQFAVRATLSGMGPAEGSTWSNAIVKKFSEFRNKLLFCQITNKDCTNKIVYLQLADYNCESQSLEPIADMLVAEKMARKLNFLDIKEMKKERSSRSKSEKNTGLSFLLPTFSDIENGVCPDSALVYNTLKEYY